MINVRRVVPILREIGSRWSDNEGSTRAAALSHYALFSLFPGLLLGVTLVGFFLGSDPGARQRILDSAALGLTPDLRKMIDDTLVAMQQSNARGWSTAIALAGLFWGATRALTELDLALRKIFRVKVPDTKTTLDSVKLYLRERVSGLVLFFGLAAVVTVSAVADVAIRFAERAAPVHAWTLWAFLHVAVTIALQTCALALLFRSRSGEMLTFRSALPGAIATSVCFQLLERSFSFYVSHLTRLSAYGVAGAVLALATFIMLVMHVLLLGAQLTSVVADNLGTSKPSPS